MSNIQTDATALFHALDKQLSALASTVKPARRQQMAKRLAKVLRAGQQARIRRQQNADESRYEARHKRTCVYKVALNFCGVVRCASYVTGEPQAEVSIDKLQAMTLIGAACVRFSKAISIVISPLIRTAPRVALAIIGNRCFVTSVFRDSCTPKGRRIRF
ncbi:hypothetical protein CEQ28_023225 [Hafnia alvei]|nr:hypothetical protein CEQ28_023225 [Hafnia alvei]